jgi:hypothetical protein
MSILGRATNARNTCRRAAEAALAHGGTGYLNTDWGDNGHLQQPVVSEPGLAYGAAVSWCLETNADLDLHEALSAHVFLDPSGALADAVLALGDLHLAVTPQFPNMSALVMNLYYPQLPVGRSLTKGLTTAEVDVVEARLDEVRGLVARATPGRADAVRLVDEVEFSLDLVALLMRDLQARLAVDGHIGSVPAEQRDALGRDLDGVTERYRWLWLERNRPGGMDDSVAWLSNLGAAYSSGRPDPNWGGISVRH